jgi:hypothetical protein
MCNFRKHDQEASDPKIRTIDRKRAVIFYDQIFYDQITEVPQPDRAPRGLQSMGILTAAKVLT